jgi:hypothetical protein
VNDGRSSTRSGRKELRTHRQVGDALQEDAGLHESSGQRLRCELPVAFAIGGELRQNQVVRFEAERQGPHLGRGARRDLDNDETVVPSERRLGGFGAARMRVVAERLVEVRAVAESAFDLDRLVRSSPRIDVDLLRPKQCLGSIGVGGEDRLAADDNELAFIDYLSAAATT